LYDRINRRVDLMVADGLVAEVESLFPYRDLNALNTVGYSEIFDYLDGNTDLPTAIAA
jgi:tRNA dimethylallyltransferase